MRARRDNLSPPVNPSGAIPVEETCILDLGWLLDSGLSIDFPLWNLINWRARWPTTPIASAWYRFLMDEEPNPILEIVYLGALSSLPSRFRQTVTLTSSPMPKGGQRLWLVCPHCHTTRAKLHLPRGGDRFLCRPCHGLTYTSCKESHRWDPVYDRFARERGITRRLAKQLMEGIAKSWAQVDTV